MNNLIIQPRLKWRVGLPVEVSVDFEETKSGYHYTTGFWHAWIEGHPGNYSLYLQEQCKSDDRTKAKLYGNGSRSQLEFKMAEIFWRWSQA